jgi:hypothetical protein
MGGGLMQLVAYGAQDVYLTGNPQITFFQIVYRRHTNFSIEAIKQDFEGTADFGSRSIVHVSRNGDLLSRIYLEHDATFTRKTHGTHDEVGHVEHYGHSLIKECDIEIGGQRIDRHDSMWNRVWSDLTEFNPSGHFGAETKITFSSALTSDSTGTLYQLMSGNGHGINTDAHDVSNDLGKGSTGGTTVNGFTYRGVNSGSVASRLTVNKIFIPLNFWFCRNPGLALPLIALQYHEVKLTFLFESLANLIRTASADNFAQGAGSAIQGTTNELIVTSNFDVWADYIYLDSDERRRFAQVSHEYLIDQVQKSNFNLTRSTTNVELQLNHPVKELIWTLRNETVTVGLGDDGGRNQPLDTDSSTTKGDVTASPVSIDDFEGKWLLKLNGHDRFAERDSRYFTRTQVWQHHTGYGSVPNGIATEADLSGGDKIVRSKSTTTAVYSFALKPEDHQPSGTCNFSRVDNVQLEVRDLKVWAEGVSTDGDYTTVGDAGATNIKLTVYAVNYNVLRIMSGMGGIAYSN